MFFCATCKLTYMTQRQIPYIEKWKKESDRVWNERPYPYTHHTCKDNNTTLIRCYLLASWFVLANLLPSWLVGCMATFRSNDATDDVFSFDFILNAFTVERLMLCAWLCDSQRDAILVVAISFDSILVRVLNCEFVHSILCLSSLLSRSYGFCMCLCRFFSFQYPFEDEYLACQSQQKSWISLQTFNHPQKYWILVEHVEQKRPTNKQFDEIIIQTRHKIKWNGVIESSEFSGVVLMK